MYDPFLEINFLQAFFLSLHLLLLFLYVTCMSLSTLGKPSAATWLWKAMTWTPKLVFVAFLTFPTDDSDWLPKLDKNWFSRRHLLHDWQAWFHQCRVEQSKTARLAYLLSIVDKLDLSMHLLARRKWWKLAEFQNKVSTALLWLALWN